MFLSLNFLTANTNEWRCISPKLKKKHVYLFEGNLILFYIILLFLSGQKKNLQEEMKVFWSVINQNTSS